MVCEDDFTWITKKSENDGLSWEETVTLMKQMLKERCSKRMMDRILITEGKLKMIQSKRLLLRETQDEVTTIWNEICERFPPLEDDISPTAEKKTEEEFQFDESMMHATNHEHDVCIVFASNGVDYGR